ncbi:MAG: hypothetical protein IIX87_04605 [Firmicutes bacterium]|nr:hypothetical protein [Bacillota bacterium]
MKIDGNVCYYFSFSIFDEETGLRTDDEQELRDAIKKAYPDALFGDDPEADNDIFFRDIHIGQGFLHGGGLPFDCFRVKLNNYSFRFKDYDVSSPAVFMTVFPEYDTVHVCVCMSVKGAEEDDFVYLRHCQGNGAKLTADDGTEISVNEIFRQVSGCLGRKITDIEETYLVEIKRYGDYSDAAELAAQEPEMLYGIMTGDEGWRNVPHELALRRLENFWGSRDFIRFISFGANSVFINFSDSETAKTYRENRRSFDGRFYGDMNPYFLMDSSIAGVNHGILFSMELVMVMRIICNRIIRRQANYYTGNQNGNLRREIRRVKAYRGELITTLNKVENLSISEIGELERVMLVSQQIDPIIEKVKYLLELLESELDLLYSTSTNRLVNFLTAAGVALTAIGLILNYI